jgi:succinate dehydrogenase / fumarate reductase membrane anchor subunit
MGNGTSIGRVRGYGAAREGTHHWITQRLTAIGNLFLGLWLLGSFLLLPDFSHGTVMDWASSPVAAVLLALLVISTFWHARLGLQVMIEDYVHDAGNKFAVIVALNLLLFAGAAFALFSIIRLALGAA